MSGEHCDWIIVHDGYCGPNAYALECLRCGQTRQDKLPLSLKEYLRFLEKFRSTHRTCAPRHAAEAAS